MVLAAACVTLLMREQRKSRRKSRKRPGRVVWMEGAFDGLHFGHVNAFRQARAHGDYLIVGINSSVSIRACKGTPPIMTDEERALAVRACRFVDEVVVNVPYVMDEDYVNMIREAYEVDVVVHGDDACTVDGKDVYAPVKKLGIFETFPRTVGISTTDLMSRLLNAYSPGACLESPHSCPSSCMTSRTFQLFLADAPSNPSRTVYVAGSWDLFHAGHIEFLRKVLPRRV
jgi:ethanolamine-phosphate cytidylyltransferase